MKPRAEFRLPWRSGARIRADLDDELEFHLHMRAEELMAKGMGRDDARREAEVQVPAEGAFASSAPDQR